MRIRSIIFALLTLMFFSFNASAQDNSDDVQLQKLIKAKLRSIVENFDSEYKGNVTFDESDIIRCNEIEVRGKVSYKGSSCGEVRADYKAEISSDGDINVCINTPICYILGSRIKWEWDCKGTQYSKDSFNILVKEASKLMKK